MIQILSRKPKIEKKKLANDMQDVKDDPKNGHFFLKKQIAKFWPILASRIRNQNSPEATEFQGKRIPDLILIVFPISVSKSVILAILITMHDNFFIQ